MSYRVPHFDDDPLITRSGVLASALTFLLGAAVVFNITVTQAGRGRSVSARDDANVVEINAASTASTQVKVASTPAPGSPPAQTQAAAPASAPAPASPAPLRKADPVLAAAQREFTALALYDGPADGLPSAALRDAVAAFQHKAGLPVTGKVDQDLLDRILLTRQIAEASGATAEIPAAASAAAAPALAATVSGEQRIRLVQTGLAELGYQPGAITGTMTAPTQSAIRQFEADRKLPQTGEISPALIDELKQISGLSALGGQ